MRDIYILSCCEDGGIYRFGFDCGRFIQKEKLPLYCPMYAVKRNGKMYVILRETDKENRFGGFISFDIAENGELLNPSELLSTNGIVPCHLDVTDNGEYIVNYLSGNIVRLSGKTVTHTGHGIHPTRQEAAHTHFVTHSPDGKFILCTDLGLDKIFVYDRELNEYSVTSLPDGSGPRHLCFSDDGGLLYCVNELSNDVSVLKWNSGKAELLKSYAAISDFSGQSTAAAIRLSGKHLYVSNRGADTISRFELVGDELRLLENTPCGGKGPRDFNIIDGHIICTNENSNSITVLRLENGKPVLTDISESLKAPLCAVI